MKSDHVRREPVAKLLDKAVMSEFPKVELHRHLEGTFALKTLHEVAMKNRLPLSRNFREFKSQVQFPRDEGPDFLKFLSKFRTDWYRSLDDVERVVFDSVLELKSDGLYYIELRFSPEHFALQNNFDRIEITRLIIDTANRAAKQIGVRVKYLITFNRNKQDQDEMIALYSKIRDLRHPDIVGVDLAGDETNFPPELFTRFFDVVRKDGLYKATIHAGEVSPPEQIWEAINLLHASRIGHGTSSINDPKLQTYLREHRIALEQCITSNYQTGSWVDEEHHPLGALYHNNVPVTINSDDPFIQDTDLTDDYVKATRYFGFTVDDFVRLNMLALETSFLNDQDKMALGQEYVRRANEFRTAHSL